MPPQKLTRPRQRQQLQTGTLIDGDPKKIGRHLSDLATAVQDTQRRISDRTVQTVNLVVGNNLINHGLGRPARGATVTPTAADASFAWALAATDDKQATIAVVGVNQPNSTVEFY